MFTSTKMHIHGHLQCFTMEHIHVYESSNEICVCRVVALSSVSIQACVSACICMHHRLLYTVHAYICMHVHSLYICCVYGGDFKAKTPLKAQSTSVARL